MNNFPKSEKLVSRALIERLFQGSGSKSISAFPLRLVYLPISEEEAAQITIDNREHLPRQVLISVPKRCFKRAVKRNHVKRQIREAYRIHRAPIISAMEDLEGTSTRLLMAFIWLDSNLHSSQEVERKVNNLLQRLAERLKHKDAVNH